MIFICVYRILSKHSFSVHFISMICLLIPLSMTVNSSEYQLLDYITDCWHLKSAIFNISTQKCWIWKVFNIRRGIFCWKPCWKRWKLMVLSVFAGCWKLHITTKIDHSSEKTLTFGNKYTRECYEYINIQTCLLKVIC